METVTEHTCRKQRHMNERYVDENDGEKKVLTSKLKYYIYIYLEYKKCYIYVKSMPLITKLLLMLLKVSYYISVISAKITAKILFDHERWKCYTICE